MLKSLVSSLFVASLLVISGKTYADTTIVAEICQHLSTPTIAIDKIQNRSDNTFYIPGNAGEADVKTELYLNGVKIDNAYSKNTGEFGFIDNLPVGSNTLYVKVFGACGAAITSQSYNYIRTPGLNAAFTFGFYFLLLILLFLLLFLLLWRRRSQKDEK